MKELNLILGMFAMSIIFYFAWGFVLMIPALFFDVGHSGMEIMFFICHFLGVGTSFIFFKSDLEQEQRDD